MKNVFIAMMLTVGLMLSLGVQLQAQDWSEYRRGSSEWHRVNREAMTRPWKRDPISGRLRGGQRSSRNGYAKHAVRRSTRR